MANAATLKATIGLAIIALALGSCALAATDGDRRTLCAARSARCTGQTFYEERRQRSAGAPHPRLRHEHLYLAAHRARACPRPTGSSPSTSRASASPTSPSTGAIRYSIRPSFSPSSSRIRICTISPWSAIPSAAASRSCLRSRTTTRLKGASRSSCCSTLIAYPQAHPGVLQPARRAPRVASRRAHGAAHRADAGRAQDRLFRRQQDRPR